MEVHVMTCVVSLISRENVLSATRCLLPLKQMFLIERSLQHLIFQQGHPTTVFCLEKQVLPQIFYCLRPQISTGFIQKIATIFQGLFKDHIRFSRTTYQEYNFTDLYKNAYSQYILIRLYTHVQYTQTDTIRQTDGPLVPMVRLVPIEKHPIPMVLLVHMHLIKGTQIIFPCDLVGYRAIPMVHW